MPSPGGRPAVRVNAATAGTSSSRMAAAMAVPSMMRALMGASDPGTTPAVPGAGGRGRRPPRVVRGPQHDEMVAGVHDRLRRRVELHVAVGPLDGHDDDAKPLAEVGV